MSYCPATDVVKQNIKRANEKKRKNLATKGAYKGSKARNLYAVPIDFRRSSTANDKEFVRIGAGKYRKTY